MGGVHKCHRFILATDKEVHELITARVSYWPKVALAESGQEVPDRVNSQVPEDEVARGRNGVVSKWPRA